MKKTAWLCSLFSTALVIGSEGSGLGQVKPTDIITKDNLAQAAELLTPATLWMVARGMSMTIRETQKVEWPQAYKEATDKFSHQVKLSADGREIYNYVAGAPFPSLDLNDPLAGFRIMWNYEQNPYIIDNVGTEFINELVNSSGEVQRTYASLWRRMTWIGRLYIDPRPVAPHNPPLHHTNLLGPVSSPREAKGTALLSMSYLSPDIPDDTYMYIPLLRRVKRLGIANRGDMVWGTDFDVDSYWGFNAKLAYWTFRVLAEKEILAVVHSGKYADRSVWCAPRDGQHGFAAAFPCVLWEKRRVWIVEGTPTGYPRPYAYSKRILYIDQDFFAPLLQEMYDQRGELWKSLLLCLFTTKRPYWGYPVWPLTGGKYNYEDEWPFIPNGVMVDMQQVHATTFDAPPGMQQVVEGQTEWYFNEDVRANSPEVYSMNYLLQSAR
jgi:hypothetical protein